ALVEQRYRTSQHDDGSWSYLYNGGKASTPQMTCVGLLGLAIAHGTAHEAATGAMPAKNDPKGAAPHRPSLKDPAIEKGLTSLARFIGFPAAAMPKKVAMGNLYFLWSVERVGVLYNLKTIGERHWYTWGAQKLLANQDGDGAWSRAGGYHGNSPTINTCFALLFLKRVNLVQDLTDNLRFMISVPDPDRIQTQKK